MKVRLFVTLMMLCSTIPIVIAQTPQRDAPAVQAIGTSTIRGRVISADPSHRPIRRARVTLGGEERVAATDDNGVFVFDKLPAGSYALAASKAAYLPMQYGAKKPGRAGTTIVLTARQTVEATIELQIGGVITGVVRDQRGRPASGVDVGVVPVLPPGPVVASFSGWAASTDDRGAYRILGCLPGSTTSRPCRRISSQTEWQDDDRLKRTTRCLRS